MLWLSSCDQLAIFRLFARPRGPDKNAAHVNIEIGGAGVLRYRYTAALCVLTCDISSVNSNIFNGLALMRRQERSQGREKEARAGKGGKGRKSRQGPEKEARAGQGKDEGDGEVAKLKILGFS